MYGMERAIAKTMRGGRMTVTVLPNMPDARIAVRWRLNGFCGMRSEDSMRTLFAWSLAGFPTLKPLP